MALSKGYSNQTYDEYFIDTKTENKSFLKVCALLRAKGVENWHFPLKVYNKKLAKLDPYDDELSDKEKLLVYKECVENRYYFLREVCRVPEQGGNSGIKGGVSFQLSRGNLALTWAIDLNLSAYQIMPRQTGKTWGAISNLQYDMHFHRNLEILHFNKNQTDSNDNLNRLKEASEMLPAWMQHSNEEYISKKEKKNIKNNIKFYRNAVGSTFRTMASAASESKADAAARGKTAAKIWVDELAFLFFNKTILEAAKPAYSKASETAAKNHMPYGIVYTTTPGDISSAHGGYAYDFMNNCITFGEHMYDFSGKKLHKHIDKLAADGKQRCLFMQFDYKMLGKTEEWYRNVVIDLGNPLRARREFGLEWINTNGNSPFDEDDMEMLQAMSSEVSKRGKSVKINKYYDMTVYEKYRGRKPVILSVDVAQGLGRDSSTVVAIHPETLRPIGVFKNNMVNARKLRKIIVKIATKIYPNCIITVENNMVGKAVLDELRHTHIRNKIYREKKIRNQDQGVGSFAKKRKYETIEYGHNTNSKSRPKMMEILETLVRYHKDHVSIPEIYNELKFFEYKNGRIDHNSASHDDVTMAYIGGLYVVRYGTGLKGTGIYFDIDNEYDPEEEAIRQQQLEKFRQTARTVDRIHRHGSDTTENDEWLDMLSTEQPVLSSFHLEQQQRQELIDIDHERNDIPDEEGYVRQKSLIPGNIDKLITQNLNFLQDNEDDSDDIYDTYGVNNSFWDS